MVFGSQTADILSRISSVTWNKLIVELEVSGISLMQAVFRQIFEDCMSEHFTITSSVHSSSEDEVTLTAHELNALRYACGYIAHSLLKTFECKTGDKFSQYITCLGEMAVVGEGEDVLESIP